MGAGHLRPGPLPFCAHPVQHRCPRRAHPPCRHVHLCRQRVGSGWPQGPGRSPSSRLVQRALAHRLPAPHHVTRSGLARAERPCGVRVGTGPAESPRSRPHRTPLRRIRLPMSSTPGVCSRPRPHLTDAARCRVRDPVATPRVGPPSERKRPPRRRVGRWFPV